jgi:SEC-C motif
MSVSKNKNRYRNLPCWCGSGRKFKKCHLSNSNLPCKGEYEIDALLNKEYRMHSCCYHPDAPEACEGRPIESHTLQRSKSLQMIADQGHVYRFRHVIADDDKIVIRRIGVKKDRKRDRKRGRESIRAGKGCQCISEQQQALIEMMSAMSIWPPSMKVREI